MNIINSIRRIVTKLLYGNYYDIPPQGRKQFKEAQYIKSYKNTLIITRVLVVITVLLIALDLSPLKLGNTDKIGTTLHRGWQLLLYTHLGLIAGLLALLTINKLGNLKNRTKATFWHKFYAVSFITFAMFCGANISLCDQLINPGITVFSYSAIATSVVMYFKPKDILLVLTGNFLYFAIMVSKIQGNTLVIADMYTNGTIAIVLGYCVSTFTSNIKVTDFINNYNLNESKQELERLTLGLQEANKKLYGYSYIDGLTGICNRRSFDNELLVEYNKHIQTGCDLSLIILDIDHFKDYNDYYGHAQGDECLKDIARLLDNTIDKSTDLVARYGGEEFAVIATNTPLEGALILAEKLRIAIEEVNIEHLMSETTDHVTISLGVASVNRENQMEPKELIVAADGSLYQAKESGRNKVGVVCL